MIICNSVVHIVVLNHVTICDAFLLGEFYRVASCFCLKLELSGLYYYKLMDLALIHSN